MRFSIVTPSFNCGQYIADTIESVISQRGDFEIEYIIVDGLSSDETEKIVAGYRKMIEEDIYPIRCRGVTLQWVSGKDRGMYDAINKGFQLASGDTLAWLNADDIYFPGAFQRIKDVFEAFPQVRWVKGITSYIDAHSAIQSIGKCYVYERSWLALGVYGRDAFFVQQDSVFWRKDLWLRRGLLDASLRAAGDYGLWLQFAKAEPLVAVNAYVSAFRKRGSQLSHDAVNYNREMELLSPSQPIMSAMRRVAFRILLRVPVCAYNLCYRMLFPLHKLRVITFDSRGKPVMKKAMGCIYRGE